MRENEDQEDAESQSSDDEDGGFETGQGMRGRPEDEFETRGGLKGRDEDEAFETKSKIFREPPEKG